jgi:hypothetical protein
MIRFLEPLVGFLKKLLIGLLSHQLASNSASRMRFTEAPSSSGEDRPKANADGIASVGGKNVRCKHFFAGRGNLRHEQPLGGVRGAREDEGVLRLTEQPGKRRVVL